MCIGVEGLGLDGVAVDDVRRAGRPGREGGEFGCGVGLCCGALLQAEGRGAGKLAGAAHFVGVVY